MQSIPFNLGLRVYSAYFWRMLLLTAATFTASFVLTHPIVNLAVWVVSFVASLWFLYIVFNKSYGELTVAMVDNKTDTRVPSPGGPLIKLWWSFTWRYYCAVMLFFLGMVVVFVLVIGGVASGMTLIEKAEHRACIQQQEAIAAGTPEKAPASAKKLDCAKLLAAPFAEPKTTEERTAARKAKREAKKQERAVVMDRIDTGEATWEDYKKILPLTPAGLIGFVTGLIAFFFISAKIFHILLGKRYVDFHVRVTYHSRNGAPA